MDPTQFPNVSPAPFQFAQVPLGLLGRSAAPTLPAVGGYSDADLERMRFALMQSGADPALLNRIQTVIAMRRGSQPPMLLRPTPTKTQRIAVGWRKHNPFDVAAAAMQPQ